MIFILKCVRIRNIFMHNIVEISSIDIKKKYCALFFNIFRITQTLFKL